MLGSMAGVLMHLPWYNVQKRVFKEAAFASISVSNNDKMFDLNYNGKKYLVLIDGQIYDIKFNSYSSFQAPTVEQLTELVKIATSIQCHNLTQIRGNYSIAVYCVDDHQLILFNDIIRPRRLYYADLNNVFTFSPEIKGICKLPEFKKEINWKELLTY
jgi:asparagine synthetase B (glutamine-hydrolysing)